MNEQQNELFSRTIDARRDVAQRLAVCNVNGKAGPIKRLTVKRLTGLPAGLFQPELMT